MTEATVSTSSVADDGSVGSGKGKARAASSKRRKVSGEDEDDEDDELPEGRVTPAPPRTLPRRAATVKKAMPVQNITDDDDDGEDGEEATPAPRRKARARAREEEVLSLVRAE
ncbi:hypothetical protein OG21DRAFT_1513848 [Imleria badia]|nr:hypothetical protein OG21DRAFT_1513848 [Imleria badia]